MNFFDEQTLGWLARLEEVGVPLFDQFPADALEQERLAVGQGGQPVDQLGRVGQLNQIRDLVKFIDWVMTLPDTLDKQIIETLSQEEEAVMQDYILSWEREAHSKGKEEGKKEGMINALLTMIEARFGEIPDWARQKAGSADESALSR